MYFDVRKLLKYNMPFNFVVGGRGTGKTYSALRMAKEEGKKFIFMRRTQTEIDMICGNDGAMSPFKTLNADFGWNVLPFRINKNVYGFYNAVLKDEKYVPDGAPIGYVMALSTVANIRGFDASDVELWIYDEFIPEMHVKQMRGEAEAFFNAYESFNRNREFSGADPIVVFLLANSNKLGNPLFNELGLTERVEKMIKKGQTFSLLKEKGITLSLLSQIELADRKAKTALYKLTEGTQFSQMAIGNKFAHDDFTGIGVRPLQEYSPVCRLKHICIYAHKSKAEYYVCDKVVKDVPLYDETTPSGVARFRASLIGRKLYGAWCNDRIIFQNFTVKENLTEVLHI